MQRVRLEARASAESYPTPQAAKSTDVDPVPTGRYFAPFAEVVELVDALRSGRSGRKPVRVRVPPSALTGGPGTASRPFPSYVTRPSNAPSPAQPARPTRLFLPPGYEPSRSPHP